MNSSIPVNVTLFLISAVVIAFAGAKQAAISDVIADKTGLGESITGTTFLGLSTALPGLVTSVTAVIEGYPALAISNAIGGIALQTAFLAIADIAYKKANLEHAAASVPNMIQTTILIILLVLVLLGFTGPNATIGHVHPMTMVIFIAAVFGFWLAYQSGKDPMWKPKQTSMTVADIPQTSNLKKSIKNLFAHFIINTLIVSIAGAAIAHTTGIIAKETGISQTMAGALLSGFVTSLPELITTISAVKNNALTLAVSDIVGGNFFDVLFVFAADLVYKKGSLFHSKGVGKREEFLTGVAILLNTILLLGLLFRQRAGPGNIGFESFLILLVYVGGMLVIIFFM